MTAVVRDLRRDTRRLAAACSGGRRSALPNRARRRATPEIFISFEDDDWTYAVVRMPKGRRRSLSPREQEVAILACQAYTNEGIGTQLGMSRGTVDSHLRRIFRKLDIHSRVELACSSAVLVQDQPDLDAEPSDEPRKPSR